ncbi:hypothetical protein ACQE3E_20965 [Methylomonas sp. MED-D]|uniref:hypothetical protein n=1 Tax=unclassified Methylomonas TaxID=2608980 RepID=UPI0028A4D385|nr:hypothetical protein [Methylomonas sp. MV1]MDT4332080.1 hypothetical protein [Methylomonas sp. MV1]
MISTPRNDFEKMFGPYSDGSCFEIEACQTLLRINKKAKKNEGVKIAEFLLLSENSINQTVQVIEAKIDPPIDEKLVSDVTEKFVNSLALFISIHVGRNRETLLPTKFSELKLAAIEFRFILAIQKIELSWIQSLQEKLKHKMQKTMNIWNIDINSVIVVDLEGAKKYGLINTTKL